MSCAVVALRSSIMTVQYYFWAKARHSSKIKIFHDTPPGFDTPLRGSPS